MINIKLGRLFKSLNDKPWIVFKKMKTSKAEMLIKKLFEKKTTKNKQKANLQKFNYNE